MKRYTVYFGRKDHIKRGATSILHQTDDFGAAKLSIQETRDRIDTEVWAHIYDNQEQKIIWTLL